MRNLKQKNNGKETAIDDGRVIAPMNVDGMKWYAPEQRMSRGRGETGGTSLPEKLTRRESMAYASGILKAVLLITLVFAGVFFLFILFCVYVWFK